MGKLFDESMVFFALVVGTFGQLVIHPLDALLQFTDVFKGLLSLFHYRSRIAQYHHLWQVSHRNILWYGHITLRRGLQSGQYLQQCTFACSIFAYQRNAVFLVNHKCHIGKQRFGGKLYL